MPQTEPASSPSLPLAVSSSRFVRACLRLPVDRTPVWFLRQAGRYMPEYMAVRKHHSLLEICRTPDIAAEVTITAAERLGVDAAIIFADLLLPFTPMGLDLEFIAGEGPVIHNPVRTLDQVKALRTDRTDELRYVARAIEKVARHFAHPISSASSVPLPPSVPLSFRSEAEESAVSTARALEGLNAPDSFAHAPQDSQDTLGIIGFCGAPFTLASYMIEGGSSRNYVETKRLMYAGGSTANAPTTFAAAGASTTFASTKDRAPLTELSSRPEASRSEVVAERPAVGPASSPRTSSSPDPSPDGQVWPLLMAKLVEVLVAYCAQQVEAGADVIQIFDSWAGALSVTDYQQYCLAATTELVRRVQALGVPVILFGVDTASLLPTLRETGADVLGLDWRIPLDQGWQAIGHSTAIQGNLDPITLFAPPEVLEARVREILRHANRRPGHIFNLGHGIVPGTPVEAVLQVVDLLRRYG